MTLGPRMLHGLAVALGVVTIVCALDSVQCVDRPFMGFVLGKP